MHKRKIFRKILRYIGLSFKGLMLSVGIELLICFLVIQLITGPGQWIELLYIVVPFLVSGPFLVSFLISLSLGMKGTMKKWEVLTIVTTLTGCGVYGAFLFIYPYVYEAIAYVAKVVFAYEVSPYALGNNLTLGLVIFYSSVIIIMVSTNLLINKGIIAMKRRKIRRYKERHRSTTM